MPFIAESWTFSNDGVWGISPWNAKVLLASVVVHSSLNGLDWKAHGRLMAAAPRMRAALMAVDAIKPTNWDDDEDPAQAAAWREVSAAIEAAQ